jgi:hypothetical protein
MAHNSATITLQTARPIPPIEKTWWLICKIARNVGIALAALPSAASQTELKAVCF